MIERVANRGARIGETGDWPARVDYARTDGEILGEKILTVKHDPRRRVGVDGDYALIERSAVPWLNRAHELSFSLVQIQYRPIIGPRHRPQPQIRIHRRGMADDGEHWIVRVAV